MSYQVIARKWRPQAFAELVGQDHIGRTLQNALKNQRLPHALLFTGPRGTGKTSTARILAKAIRCQNAVDFIPCHNCESCLEIAQSRSVDVIEIDGASNNGVDAIRELRDTVSFMPATGSHKVYIIDEVHMLSTSAFNALLKTLEEPPAHVIFILATTEVHKIPQTILSRCQRFDFRRISTKLITEHLSHICSTEDIKAEPESLWIIARQGDGSMRDSQSLLEQVITFTDKNLTKEKVVEILGLTDRALLLDTLRAVINRENASIIKIIQRLMQTSIEPQKFAEEFLETVRNITICKISAEASSMILDLPDSEIALLLDLSNSVTEEDLQVLFDMTLKGVSDILKSHDPRLVLEMVLIRLAQAPHLISIQKLIQLLEKNPNASPTLTNTQAQPSASPHPVKSSPKPAQSILQKPQVSVSKPTAGPISELNLSSTDKWLQFVSRVKAQDTLLGAKLESILFLSDANKKLSLGAPARLGFLKNQLSEPNTSKKIQAFIDSQWGAGYAFEIQAIKGAETGVSAQALVDSKEKAETDKIRQQINEHPLVKTAQAVFKGQIKSIKETP